MSRDLTDSSKATELLKEILKLGQSHSSPVVAPGGAAIVGRTSPFNAVVASELALKQSFINGNSGKKSNIVMMNSENETEEINELHQQIVLTNSDESFSYQVYGTEVDILCYKTNHTSGSSKVKISNIVNSSWECHYYYGQLVTAHLSKNFIAYVLKIPQSNDGVVRVISRKPNGGRLLLKGMRGLVIDVAFAHINTEIILGTVDEYGNIFVYSIKEEGSVLTESLILEVRRPEEKSNKSKFRRLIWCPFVEEPNTDEELDPSDCAKLMVVTCGNEAEIWNVDTILKEYGCGPLSTEGITEGYTLIKEHDQNITDAAFPPDGSAFASSSEDGSVKFFKITDNNEMQSCIHNWIPHEGRPLSCLFFLDNKKSANIDVQYWKYAITGCDQNRELKVWNCESWKCLQTIRFQANEDVKIQPQLKARLDESAEFLILSNISHRVLYVLHIYQDQENSMAKVVSISEFPVTFPILSLDLLEVRRKKFKQSSDDEQLEEFELNEPSVIDEFSDESVKVEDVVNGLVVKLVYVHPKSVQECVIVFQPSLPFEKSFASIGNVSQDSLYFKEKLSDVSFESDFMTKSRTSFNVSGNESAIYHSMDKNISSLLLTPDAFTLPANESNSTKNSADRSLVKLEDLPSPSSALQLSPTLTHNKPSDNTHSKSCSPKDLEEKIQKRDSLKSTGSSPSLEVQEILNKSLAEEIAEMKSNETQLKASIQNDDSNIMETLNQPDNLSNLINLVSGGDRAKKLNEFGLLSSTSEDFTKQSSAHTGWPTTTTIPQHPVTTEEKLDSPTTKSLRNNQNQEKNFLERLSNNMVIVTQGMQNILRVLDSQQSQLNTLTDCMADFHSGRFASKQMTMMGNFQKELTNTLKSLLEKHHQAETNIISGLLKSHEDRAFTQLSTNCNFSRLEAAMKMEFQNCLVPILTREMKQMESQIHSELTTRLATTDSLLKENLHRLVESKSFLSGVSGAVATSIQGSIRASFQEIIQANVIPVFERLCHNMFIQINEAFQSGTKEYMKQLDGNIAKDYRQNQEFVNEQLTEVIGKVQSSTEQLASSASSEISNQLQLTLKRFEDQITSRITLLLQEQMSVAMKEHQTVIGNTVVNAIRSRTVTPVPTDFQISQTQILQLVAQGQINAAFKQALSVNDLGLVIFLCEKVSAAQVFGQSPCPLQTPVLLALISQLPIDLEINTELKHEYLKEALVNLDFSDPITCSHFPRVLEILRQKLQNYIQTHPSNKITKDIKLLLMATNSLKSNLP